MSLFYVVQMEGHSTVHTDGADELCRPGFGYKVYERLVRTIRFNE